MKKTKRLYGIIAIIAIIALSMTACDMGDGNGNNNNNNGNYLIKGQFANQEAGVNATFYANTAAITASYRSAAASEALTGKIEDGQIIFNLTGVYFPDSGSFILSAGSSFLVYEIAGTVNNNGSLTETQATVKINNNTTGGDWTTFQINVTTANNVSITEAASSEQTSGLPSNWLGNWTFGDYGEVWHDPCEICDEPNNCEGHPNGEYSETNMIITQFGVSYIDRDDGKTYPYFNILEVASVDNTNTKYDSVILFEGGSVSGSCSDCEDMNFCPPDCGCGNECECNEESVSILYYTKIRIMQPYPNTLKLIIPDFDETNLIEVEEEGSLAFVRAINFDLINDVLTMDLTR